MRLFLLGVSAWLACLSPWAAAAECPEFLEKGEKYLIYLPDFKLTVEILDYEDDACWVKFKEQGTTKWLNLEQAIMIESTK